MSPNRHNSDKPAESRRPHTRSESRRAEEGEFVSSEIMDQVQREAEGELSGIPRFDFNSLEATEQNQQEAEGEFRGIPELVTDSSSTNTKKIPCHIHILSIMMRPTRKHICVLF